MTTRRERFIFISLLLLAFGLRLHNLGAQSLWYDETVSVYLAQQSIPNLLAHTALDIHPPGYYFLLHAWLQFVQAQPALEFPSAFFSLCFSIAILPMLYVLGRRLNLSKAACILGVAIASVASHHVWYAQEVRMYTAGAFLGLLCTWFLLKAQRGNSKTALWFWAGYAIASAIGLYTLYYFAFLLISINFLIVLAQLRQRKSNGQFIKKWGVANVAIVMVYAPWLGIAWQQATNPPVPPWRAFTPVQDVFVESLLALGFGQSLLSNQVTIGLITIIILMGVAFLSLKRQWKTLGFLLGYTFLPLSLIYVISVVKTPLYHVRYVFTYAPPFALLLATGFIHVWNQKRAVWRILAASFFIAFVGLNTLSLHQFWTSPTFAADDHRGAVSFLSNRWRPGDVILVNAGYAYTALLTYWDKPISWRGRLTDFSPALAIQLEHADGAIILQTGSIDGDPNLGWGNANADFYSLPAKTARQQLAELQTKFNRLWQYRIYDTVTDPSGFVRQELANNWVLFEDDVFSGVSNLRVQGFWNTEAANFSGNIKQRWLIDPWLRVAQIGDVTPQIVANEEPINASFYLQRVSNSAFPVSVSLRLVDKFGNVWAQHDESLGGNQRDLQTTKSFPVPLQITPLLGTPSGEYKLTAIFYDSTTGQAWPITGQQGNETSIALGTIAIKSKISSLNRREIGTFADRVRLLEASTPATSISSGDSIPLKLLWQAKTAVKPETLIIVTQLLDSSGKVVVSKESPLIFHEVGQWQSGEILEDRQSLETVRGTKRGTYQLIIGLYEAGQTTRLTASCGILGLAQCRHIVVKTIDIQ